MKDFTNYGNFNISFCNGNYAESRITEVNIIPFSNGNKCKTTRWLCTKLLQVAIAASSVADQVQNGSDDFHDLQQSNLIISQSSLAVCMQLTFINYRYSIAVQLLSKIEAAHHSYHHSAQVCYM